MNFVLSFQSTEIILELCFVLHHTSHLHQISRSIVFSSVLRIAVLTSYKVRNETLSPQNTSLLGDIKLLMDIFHYYFQYNASIRLCWLLSRPIQDRTGTLLCLVFPVTFGTVHDMHPKRYPVNHLF